jgi:hypothetical protein
MGASLDLGKNMCEVSRVRLGLAPGEAQYDELETRLVEGLVITAPTITLEGDANRAPHPDSSSYAKKFPGSYAHRTVDVGSGTICHRKPYRLSTERWSMSMAFDRHWPW